MVSLFNFFSLVFSCLPQPRIADYLNTSVKLRILRDENEAMKQKILSVDAFLRKNADMSLNDLTYAETEAPAEIMDDFYTIAAQEVPVSSAESQKTLKSFLRTFTGGSSLSSSQAQSSSVS